MRPFSFLILFTVGLAAVAACEQTKTTKIKPVVLTTNADSPSTVAEKPSDQTDDVKPSASDQDRSSGPSVPTDDEDLSKFTIEDLEKATDRGEFDLADKLVAHFVKKDPHSIRLQIARQKLASNYSRARQDEPAMRINRELLKYFMQYADGNRELCEIFPTTVMFLNTKLARQKEHIERKKIVDDALQILIKNQPKYVDSKKLSTGVGLVAGIKILDLAMDSNTRDEAIQFAESEITRTGKLFESKPEDKWHAFAHGVAIRNAFINLPFQTEVNPERTKKFETLVVKFIDQDPKDPLFANEYYGVVQKRLSLMLNANPLEAGDYYERSCARLRKLIEAQPENSGLARNLQFLKRVESRIDAAVEIAKLFDSKAKPIEAQRWLNTTADEVEKRTMGRAVLYVFLSATSRPTVNMLPKINTLALENRGKLEVIGVTKQYNYQWDEAKGRVTRSAAPVSLDDEVAMLEKFTKASNFAFPLAVADDTAYRNYGVRSIPHFVLVDSSGIIRDITIGSDPRRWVKLRKKALSLGEDR